MPLTVVKYPARILLRPARRIDGRDGVELASLFEQMVETMQTEHGVGLAAPQVGKSIRFIVARDVERSEYRAMVNPQITKYSSETEVGSEGCLSFPGQFGDIERALEITVRYQDLDGREQELEDDGMLARILQHEIDHLDGVLFVDHLSLLKRKLIARKLKELQRRAREQMQSLS